MVRGEIYWAELKPRSKSEQSGRRPVVIVSNDGFNRISAWQSIVVVPLSTSVNQNSRGPTAVKIPKHIAAIEKSSLALCHQVTTLDRTKLTQRVGTLPRNYLSEINKGLMNALDLWEEF